MQKTQIIDKLNHAIKNTCNKEESSRVPSDQLNPVAMHKEKSLPVVAKVVTTFPPDICIELSVGYTEHQPLTWQC